MIDQKRIDEIRLMPITKAKAAMKEYAAELGVTVKAKTIDNMVSEMGAQIGSPETRVKSVASVPAALNPIKTRGFMLYAIPTEIADIDNCTFRWQHKSTAGGATFTDIVGATEQKYKVAVTDNPHLGEYRCIIREAAGTETTSSVSKVETLATFPPDFPMINLYTAKWIDFYGCSFAPVYWGGIYQMQNILADDDVNVNTSVIHRTMALRKDSVPLLDLISNTSFLVATDSRDGYRYLIGSDTDKNTPIKIIGRFNKND